MNLFNYQWRSINEKKIDFVKSKLHLNENIEWHCMQFELNWIRIFLNLNLKKIERDLIEQNWDAN
jgi:hypothetical protein